MAYRNYDQFNRDADMYGEELLDIVNTPTAPQKTIGPRPTGDNDLLYNALNLNNPATAPVVAPAAAPPVSGGYKYTGGSLQDYLSEQQSTFKPQLLQASTRGLTEGGEYYTPEVYSTFDPNQATQNYIKQRDTARTGIAPELSTFLSGMGQYQEYTDKLADAIGYTGPKTYEAENPYFSGATNESGEVSTVPEINQLHPDFLDALSGYKFEKSIIGSNDPAVNIYKPDGSSLGKYRVGNNPETSFDRIMEVVLPGALAALTGGALAGPLLGAFGVAAPTALASTATAGAIGGGLNAGIHGGNVLEGILKGGLTAGVTGGVSEVLGSTFAPSGVGSQVQNAISTGLKDIGLPADAANYVASYTKPFVSGALTEGAKAALKGDNVLEGALIGGVTGAGNQAVGELFKGAKGVATAQPVKDAIFEGLTNLGLSENTAGYIEGLLQPAVEGGLNAAIRGDSVFGGMTAGALDSVAGDVGKSLGLNKTQSQAVAKWMRTGDELELANTLGKDLTNKAVGAAKESAKNFAKTSPIDAELGFSQSASKSTPSYPADAQMEQAPLSYEELLASLSPTTPAAGQVTVTGQQPIDEELGFANYFPVPRVNITGEKVKEELPADTRMSGERSNISLDPNAGPQQVTVTGKKEEDYLYNPAPRPITAIQPSTEVDVGKYLDKLPEDVYKTLPEIIAAPSPSPAPSPAPAPAAPVAFPPLKVPSG